MNNEIVYQEVSKSAISGSRLVEIFQSYTLREINRRMSAMYERAAELRTEADDLAYCADLSGWGGRADKQADFAWRAAALSVQAETLYGQAECIRLALLEVRLARAERTGRAGLAVN